MRPQIANAPPSDFAAAIPSFISAHTWRKSVPKRIKRREVTGESKA